MSTTLLPHITATLNAASAILLLLGFTMIRSRNRTAHRAVMLAAVVVSAVFLAFYLVYHFTQPIFVFTGQGLVRPLYYVLLVSHVGLALVVVPMIVFTLRRALKGNFDSHRGLARWTLPVWLYVSVTGVVVYVMLYHIYTPVV